MTHTQTNSSLTPLWDCHGHLSFLRENESRDILENNSEYAWVLGGYQPSEWEHQVSLKKNFPERIKTCYGLHPWYVKSDEFNLERDIEALKIWVDQADMIGEVGLDFFGDEAHTKKELQINVFEKQLEISSSKPYVFHIVQAHGKALEILKDYKVKGFVHGFSGAIEVAEQYVAQGILLSFGPGILNENFKKAKEALKHLPLESILIESDSPSDPLDEPQPVAILEKVYQEAARIKEVEVSELKAQVKANFQRLITP